MKFVECPLLGAWRVEPERFEDDRGHFARTFCRQEFLEHGLEPDVVQCSTSFNRTRHTLRGMHWQLDPHAEDKLVRCTSGSVFDVIVDLRRSSPTYSQWWGWELTAVSGTQIYVPKGFAHGFMTLEDSTEVAYQMSVRFAPGHDAGIRYDDPGIGIEWPAEPKIMSEKDLELPTLSELESNGSGEPL